MAEAFKHRLNNDYYRFKIVLYNDNQKAQVISPTAIKSLVIEDCFYNFFHKGYIIIDNRFDALERSIGETLDPSTNGNRPPSFIFLGDARDYINVEIYPLGESNELATKEFAMNSRIFFEATIYAIEEIATETPDVKYKKLYFWDRYYQTMLEKNIYWSTSNVVENRLFGESEDTTALDESEEYAEIIDELKSLKVKNIINFDNNLRGIPTGEAVRQLISDVFPSNSEYPAAFAGPDFASSGDYTTDASIRANDPTWDIGATTVFFSTPARYKAIDCLVYLMARHVSNADNNYDLAFLRIDRATRVFTFRPLSSYFKAAWEGNAAGPLYLETLMLGGFGYPEATDMRYSLVADYTPTIGAVQLVEIGSTVNFSHEPSLGIESQKKFNSKLVHSHSMEDKQFQIDKVKNDMYSIMQTYQENYVDTLKSNKWSSIVPGINRVNNVNVENKYSTIEQDSQQRIAKGRNDALYASIFANNQVKFRVPGTSLRQAGKFVGVDRSGSSPANEFDVKFLGVYFVTEVKHIFEGNNYSNELTCVKTYTDLPIYRGQVGSGVDLSNLDAQQIP